MKLNHALVAVVFALLAACATPDSGYRDTTRNISSMTSLDLARYAGLWYVVGRFSTDAQTNCFAPTSQISVLGEGEVSFLNTCHLDTVQGPAQQARARGIVTGPGRLDVSQSGGPGEPYWVLWLDWDYRTAVIGMPSGEKGWILNRDPTIPADRLTAARNILEFNGYDASRLEMLPQPAR